MKKMLVTLAVFIIFTLPRNIAEMNLDLSSIFFDFSAPADTPVNIVADQAPLDADIPLEPSRTITRPIMLSIGTGRVYTSFFDGALTLRKGPSVHTPALNWLDEGTPFVVLFEEQNNKKQDWIMVQVASQVGWVNKSYTVTTFHETTQFSRPFE